MKLGIISIHSKMLLLLYDKLWQINYGQKVFSEKAEPLILTVNKSQSFPNWKVLLYSP